MHQVFLYILNSRVQTPYVLLVLLLWWSMCLEFEDDQLLACWCMLKSLSFIHHSEADDKASQLQFYFSVVKIRKQTGYEPDSLWAQLGHWLTNIDVCCSLISREQLFSYCSTLIRIKCRYLICISMLYGFNVIWISTLISASLVYLNAFEQFSNISFLSEFS